MSESTTLPKETPSKDTPSKDTVTVTVDGRTFEARPGELVIAAAERHGVYIPRFCWHPRMKPVGMCRMCLVEIEGVRGLPPACTTPVAEGMVVHTTSPGVKKAQDGVLEFLLINHPLDCPVCDRGGECPLQDQTFAFGPGESRFVEEKRHFEKPIPISDLVALDRERCILCARCTRFADEVAGDPLISFNERGNETQVLTFPDDPFASYFSGNTVQICPVGALTATPYRFRARPWDLEQVESTCTTCAVGCRIAAQSSSNRLVRYLGVDAEPTNHGWLCDKGRFGFEAINAEDRLTTPLVRATGADRVSEASWGQALDAAAHGLRRARDLHGSGAIAVLGGARLGNEDAYAWAKLAKAVLGTDSVDCQLGDGLPADVVLGLPRATIDDACSASVVIVLAPDLKEELPVLYLRLREAVVDDGAVLIELAPQDTGLTRHARASLLYRPGEAAALAEALVGGDGDIAYAAGVATADIAAARKLLEGHDDVVVVLGRPSLAESEASIAEAAAVLATGLPNARFLPALRRGNVLGALDMGMAPGILPGRVALEDGHAWFVDAWGAAPEETGLDAHGILRAAADGRIHALVLLGADPLADFPDRVLARRALAAAGFVIAVDLFVTDSVRQADVVFPAAGFGERPATTTNLEGRITRLGQKVTPPGTARPDWMIAVDLAARLGDDLGFESLDDIWSEIERVAPAHAGITLDLLREIDHRDGVVVPLTGEDEHDHTARTTAEVDVADRVIEAIETRAAASQGEGVVTQAASGTASADSGHADSGHADSPEVADSTTDTDRPALLTFAARDRLRSLPALDAYALRLVSTRSLYDLGAMVQHCPSMAHLAPGPRVRVNPHDLERLGLASGDRVRMVSSRATTELPVTAWSGLPRGSISITFNQPGQIAAADIIDASQPVTDIRMESL
jgi:NADH-quinone oxidoreductase subunit G